MIRLFSIFLAASFCLGIQAQRYIKVVGTFADLRAANTADVTGTNIFVNGSVTNNDGYQSIWSWTPNDATTTNATIFSSTSGGIGRWRRQIDFRAPLVGTVLNSGASTTNMVLSYLDTSGTNVSPAAIIAGTAVTITRDQYGFTFNASGGGGAAPAGTMVHSGSSGIFKIAVSPDSTGTNWVSRDIIAGSNITLTTNSSGFTIATTSEFNGTSGTVINTGSGAVFKVPVYSDTTGTNVTPKSILAGSNITLTTNSSGFTIGTTSEFTGTAGTVINSGASNTNKIPAYADTSGTNVVPVSLIAGTGMTITRGSTNFTFDSTVTGGTAGTIINTGTSALFKVPVYSDTTGTNVSPKSILVDSTLALTTNSTGFNLAAKSTTVYNSFGSNTTNDIAFFDNFGGHDLLPKTLLAGTNVVFTGSSTSLTINASASSGGDHVVEVVVSPLAGVWLTATGPITNSGTITLNTAGVAANTALYGPTTGGNDHPDFRPMVAADIPVGIIVASTKLSATGTPSASTVLYGNDTWGTISAGSAPTGMVSRIAAFDGSGNLSNAWITYTNQYLIPDTNNVLNVGSTTNRLKSVAFVDGNFSGQITSTIASGSGPPFIVASTTEVSNLNAQKLGGHDSQYYNPGFVLGDTWYDNASGVPTQFPPNQTTNFAFYASVGTGAGYPGGNAPFWGKLTAGTNIVFTQTSTTNFIINSSASGGGGGTSGTVINTGSSAIFQVPVYSDTTGTNVSAKDILAGSNITITTNSSGFTIATTSGPGTAGTVISGSGSSTTNDIAVFSDTTGTNVLAKTLLLTNITRTATASTISLTGNAGTVTSVDDGGLTDLFTTSGGPVTSSGSFSHAKISQAANLFYASPNGSSGNPTFRSLAVGDFPDGTSFITKVTSIGTGTNGQKTLIASIPGGKRYIVTALDLEVTAVTNPGMSAVLSFSFTLGIGATVDNIWKGVQSMDGSDTVIVVGSYHSYVRAADPAVQQTVAVASDAIKIDITRDGATTAGDYVTLTAYLHGYYTP